MEGKFQTSFIPKKTFSQMPVQKRSGAGGIAGPIVWGVFIIALIVSGAMWGYTTYLQHEISNGQNNLHVAIEQLSPGTISQLSQEDERLKAASYLLSTHEAPSGLFYFLADNTLANVRFSNFSYSASDSGVSLTLKGEAQSFSDVALQLNQFNSAEDQQYISDPVFSNLGLDDFGNVTFNFTATVNPQAFLYKNVPGSVSTTTSATSTKSS